MRHVVIRDQSIHNGIYSIMSQGVSSDNTTTLKGYNPYWRLALNHDWGANSAMIGLHGLNARVYSDPTNASSPLIRNDDVGIDGQFQHILDPHTFSAQFSYTRERQQFGRAIASFQAIKHKAADMMLKAEACRSAVYYAACVGQEALTGGALGSELASAASLAKAYCSEA